MPANALNSLAATYNQLGSIFGDIGDLDTALTYYRQGIRCEEAHGNPFGAGGTRFNVAIDLAKSGRFPEAIEWARAALRDFEGSENADSEIVNAAELIRRIESDLSRTPPQQ
jgi:tetratricopeptide (TPR) repeat protein